MCHQHSEAQGASEGAALAYPELYYYIMESVRETHYKGVLVRVVPLCGWVLVDKEGQRDSVAPTAAAALIFLRSLRLLILC